MMILEFSIGVEEKYLTELADILDDFGIQPTHIGEYEHMMFGKEPTFKVDCLGPINRMGSFIKHLDADVEFTTILTR